MIHLYDDTVLLSAREKKKIEEIEKKEEGKRMSNERQKEWERERNKDTFTTTIILYRITTASVSQLVKIEKTKE